MAASTVLARFVKTASSDSESCYSGKTLRRKAEKMHKMKSDRKLAYDVLNTISKNRIEIMREGQNGVSPKQCYDRYLIINANINTEIV